MKIPTYVFRLRDAAVRSEPKIFVDLLVSTDRFYRNEKSQIMFKVAPNDYCLLERKNDLAEVIADGEVIRVEGDLGTACTDCLWFWLTARKFTLPRIGGTYQHYVPPGVAHIAPQDRYQRGRDVA